MSDFSENYIALRKQEGRLLTDEQVRRLPIFSGEKSLEKEWRLRKDSFDRFLDYLKVNKPKTILEIGCGNGWFAAQMAALHFPKVVAIDVNQVELEQARRVFGNENPLFRKTDIFSADLESERFDLIVLNASVQYFPDFKKLIQRLENFLNTQGEIHVFDSPFYKTSEISNAKKRSQMYYTSKGFPDLNEHYFHHSWEETKQLGVKVMYQPFSVRIGNLLGKNPFPWLRWIKY